MSKINIDRIIKDIKSKTTSLTPVIEAVCNSIDAIGTERTDGVIDIIVKRTGQRSLNLDNTNTLSDIVSIDIIDNGIGFTEENKDSFDTYRSGFKMSKGGKGFGRFMYLKYFNNVSIESVFCEDGKYKQRSFTFGHADEIIENGMLYTLVTNIDSAEIPNGFTSITNTYQDKDIVMAISEDGNISMVPFVAANDTKNIKWYTLDNEGNIDKPMEIINLEGKDYMLIEPSADNSLIMIETGDNNFTGFINLYYKIPFIITTFYRKLFFFANLLNIGIFSNIIV